MQTITSRGGHGALPVIDSGRPRRRGRPGCPRFIDLGIQPVNVVIIRDGSRVVSMIPMSGKGRGALRGSRVSVAVLDCVVGRSLTQLLSNRTFLSIPEVLYSGVVGIRVIVLHIWIRGHAPLLVSGLVLPQLSVTCLDSDSQVERWLGQHILLKSF